MFESLPEPSRRPSPNPDSSSSDSIEEPVPGGDIPRTAHNFEFSLRVRDSVHCFFRPKDPDHLVMNGRRDEINSTVLYCSCAWIERCHNIQTEILDILDSDRSVEKKLEAAALHAEYPRFVLYHVKKFAAARYDTIRLFAYPQSRIRPSR